MPQDNTDHHNPPPYDPSDRREVGTGTDFAVDLWSLYKAGRVHFPELAAFYSGVTSATHDAAQRVGFLRASTGGEYALTLVDGLRELLQVELRRTSLALSETGQALVEIADDYATTDAEANRHFKHLARTADPFVVPYVPSPPGLDAPYENQYDAPALPGDEPEPLPPTSPHLPSPDRDLDDLVPEEPTQEHAPTPEQQLPWLPPGLLEDLPDPQPVPEPDSPLPDLAGPWSGSDLDDGENELHLDDLIETPDEWAEEQLDPGAWGERNGR